jgi:4-diphosphocytidyl-2-C-methyl-D-erythritol kinase
MITTVQQAHAKLNLLLGITPKLIGGKHQLTTVFTAISLADTLTFTFDDTVSRAVTLEVTSASDLEALTIPADQNIVHAAVGVMEQVCGRSLQGHFHIAIEKRIPHQAGLAGGSTDAAAALRVIADLWEMSLDDPLLGTAAQILGADVAFFLRGGCALMGGAGEKLIRHLPQPVLDLVLVKPAEGIATIDAYRAFDADPQPVLSAESFVRLLETPGTQPKDIAGALANNLYPAACALMPPLGDLVAAIEEQPGVYAALLAGSGSTVFGICENARAAERVADTFKKQGYWVRACTTA